MTDRAGGLTASQLVLGLMLLAIGLSAALPPIGRALTDRQVTEARDLAVELAAVARTMARERGQGVRLEIDPTLARGRILVELPEGRTQTVQSVEFWNQFGTAVRTSAGRVTVCYTPRGFARPSCGSFAGRTDPITIVFVRGGRDAALRIRPLGQVDRQ